MDGQRDAIPALIERTLTLDRRQFSDALQQELAGHQKNLDLLRRAIEDVLHPRD